MARNLKRFFFAAIAALAVLCQAPGEVQADSNAGTAGTWDWTDASAWIGGVPGVGTTTNVGHNGGGEVPGVNMEITGSTAANAGHFVLYNDSTLMIEAGSSLTISNSFANNFNSTGTSKIFIYGSVLVPNTVALNGDEYRIYNGGSLETTSGGSFRLAQGSGDTLWTIDPGAYFNFSGTDANTTENNPGATATVNQAGGLVKFLNSNFTLNAGGLSSGANTTDWNLSGGELAIGGTYAKTIGNGGIHLSGSGQFYLAGDQTGDLTHGGLITGAVSASFGNYVLSDSTALNGYTLFEGAPVPEPSSFALAALGLVGLGWFGVRRRHKA